MMSAPSTVGSTFALPGPKTYTFETLLSLVEALTLKKLKGPNFPRPVLALAARLWDLVWWPTVSPDEVVRRYINDVPVTAGLKGFEDLGIEPDVLEEVAIVYLRRYRSSAYYDLVRLHPLPLSYRQVLTICGCAADSNWRSQVEGTYIPRRRLEQSCHICSIYRVFSSNPSHTR
jgi:hypothetical protein